MKCPNFSSSHTSFLETEKWWKIFSGKNSGKNFPQKLLETIFRWKMFSTEQMNSLLNYSKWVDQMHFKTIFFWLLLLKAKMTNSGHLPLWGLFTEKPVVMIMMHARRINFLMIIYLLKNWISILKLESQHHKIEKILLVGFEKLKRFLWFICW